MAKASRHTKPAEQATAGEHSRRTLRPAQTLKQQQPASSCLASQQNNSRRRQSWPASRRAVQVDGGSAVVLALRRRAQTYLTISLPPIAFACHCLYPLPLI